MGSDMGMRAERPPRRAQEPGLRPRQMRGDEAVLLSPVPAAPMPNPPLTEMDWEVEQTLLCQTAQVANSACSVNSTRDHPTPD